MDKKLRIAVGCVFLVGAALVWFSGDPEAGTTGTTAGTTSSAATGDAPAAAGPALAKGKKATATAELGATHTPRPRPDPAPALSPAPGGPYPRTAQSMLALSWQPAFCETHRQKPECRNEGPDSLQATQLSLHGLWPDGCAYAGVSAAVKQADQRSRWRDLPATELSRSTREALAKIMPGTLSMLDRHEWIKHGTCDGRDAEAYYATSIALTEQVNRSAVGELLRRRVGQVITVAQLRTAMRESFGPHAGDAVVMKCKGGMVQEIRLRLGRPLGPDTDIGTVLQRNTAKSCKSGRIDPGG